MDKKKRKVMFLLEKVGGAGKVGQENEDCCGWMPWWRKWT